MCHRRQHYSRPLLSFRRTSSERAPWTVYGNFKFLKLYFPVELGGLLKGAVENVAGEEREVRTRSDLTWGSKGTTSGVATTLP